jgi:ent-kaurene synthase
MDEQIVSPLGFNITFGGMLTLAKGMGLTFPNRQTDINWILELREMELKRFVITI